jgi:hypothetical protein
MTTSRFTGVDQGEYVGIAPEEDCSTTTTVAQNDTECMIPDIFTSFLRRGLNGQRSGRIPRTGSAAYATLGQS